jgi:hypothetical protein
VECETKPKARRREILPSAVHHQHIAPKYSAAASGSSDVECSKIMFKDKDGGHGRLALLQGKIDEHFWAGHTHCRKYMHACGICYIRS